MGVNVRLRVGRGDPEGDVPVVVASIGLSVRLGKSRRPRTVPSYVDLAEHTPSALQPWSTVAEPGRSTRSPSLQAPFWQAFRCNVPTDAEYQAATVTDTPVTCPMAGQATGRGSQLGSSAEALTRVNANAIFPMASG
ncbi:hypothetical protein ACIPY2_17140 [Paenarthrobacter sp. NPDC089675]|uniref:hypothetical protein n=1 Tax=Paenarthrobacter sp. NPDC089675 TaxID=3364376 RepID=UPI00380F412C